MNRQQRVGHVVALVVIGVSVLAVPALAQDCPELVGFVDTPGEAFGVAVAGAYAYVADTTAGLRVVDVSNPAAPFEVGSYDTPGWAYGVAVAGSYAYVADFLDGLRVVDVSNPAAPVEVGSYDTPGAAYGIAVAGSYAYVADTTAGLEVLTSCEGLIFQNGFESGDTSAWSATVP